MTKVYGPYADGDGYRIRWDKPEGGRTSRRFADKASARAFAADLRGSPAPTAPQHVAVSEAGAVPTADDVLRLMWAQMLAVVDSGDDPLRIAKTLSPMAASVKHYIEVREQEKRIAELEQAMTGMLEAAKTRAGAHQRTTAARAGGVSGRKEPVH